MGQDAEWPRKADSATRSKKEHAGWSYACLQKLSELEAHTKGKSSRGRGVLTSIKVGQGLEEEVPLGNLVSVKDTHQLVPWDGILLGVDLVQGIIHVARLAVHLPCEAHTPGHIHHLLTHALTPARMHPIRKENIRKDYTFWYQSDEKPSITPGCPEHACNHCSIACT